MHNTEGNYSKVYRGNFCYSAFNSIFQQQHIVSEKSIVCEIILKLQRNALTAMTTACTWQVLTAECVARQTELVNKLG